MEELVYFNLFLLINLAPRSGLANKFMLDIGAGVIDEDYRG